MHSVNGVAVAAQEAGLLPLSQHSTLVLSSHLGAKRFLMLRNHGLLTIGRTVAEAFVAMYFFETSCMIQVRAGGGQPLRRIGAEVLEGSVKSWETVTRGAGAGLAWPALLRRLDRENPGYRD